VPAPAPLGRPSRYSRKIANKICALLATGKTLRAICRDDDSLPDESTVRKWAVNDVNGFFPLYARAREMGLDSMADECIEISDERLPERRVSQSAKRKADGSIEAEVAGHVNITTTDNVARATLKLDARKWYLSKLAPKRYAERIKIEDEGARAIAGNLLKELAEAMRQSPTLPDDDTIPRPRLRGGRESSLAAADVLKQEIGDDEG